MRILILTHPRSGGFTFLSWIASELQLKAYHEPLLNPSANPDIWNPILCSDLVIKEHISRFADVGMSIQEVTEGFDKVVFHTREDLHAAGISRAKQHETGDSHLVYHMDMAWEESHSVEIGKASKEISDLRDSVLLQASGCDSPHIITTYCGIYQEFTDIPIITKFLGISDPQWLSIIHPKRRLQNGNSLIDKPRKKIKFI